MFLFVRIALTVRSAGEKHYSFELYKIDERVHKRWCWINEADMSLYGTYVGIKFVCLYW